MNVDNPPQPHGRSAPIARSAVKNTSVTLEPEVLAYLGELQNAAERSRSWLINQIVKQHRDVSLQLRARERSPLGQSSRDLSSFAAG